MSSKILFVQQISYLGRLLALAHFTIEFIPVMEYNFQCFKWMKVACYIVIIHRKLIRLHQTIAAAIGARMASHITLTPRETNGKTIVEFLWLIIRASVISKLTMTIIIFCLKAKTVYAV